MSIPGTQKEKGNGGYDLEAIISRAKQDTNSGIRPDVFLKSSAPVIEVSVTEVANVGPAQIALPDQSTDMERWNDLVAEKKRLKANLEELERELGSKKLELERMTDELENRNKKISGLEGEDKINKAKIAQLSGEVGELQKRINIMKSGPVFLKVNSKGKISRTPVDGYEKVEAKIESRVAEKRISVFVNSLIAVDKKTAQGFFKKGEIGALNEMRSFFEGETFANALRSKIDEVDRNNIIPGKEVFVGKQIERYKKEILKVVNDLIEKDGEMNGAERSGYSNFGNIGAGEELYNSLVAAERAEKEKAEEVAKLEVERVTKLRKKEDEEILDGFHQQLKQDLLSRDVEISSQAIKDRVQRGIIKGALGKVRAHVNEREMWINMRQASQNFNEQLREKEKEEEIRLARIKMLENYVDLTQGVVFSVFKYIQEQVADGLLDIELYKREYQDQILSLLQEKGVLNQVKEMVSSFPIIFFEKDNTEKEFIFDTKEEVVRFVNGYLKALVDLKLSKVDPDVRLIIKPKVKAKSK